MEIEISYPAPDPYNPSKELLAAINTALFLQRPLLLSGEPGTGKTECANFIARQLHAHYRNLFTHTRALRFDTKSTSQSGDLFYSYDAVAHFADKTGMPKEHFISLNGAGAALMATNKPVDTFLKFRNFNSVPYREGEPAGSVVLIDEIDKAPRDFPNDLLSELEKPPFKFSIKELPGCTIQQDARYPVVIVITSNSEKGLPDAFLRRCVFHHISFPDSRQLLEIVQSNLRAEHTYFKAAIKKFTEIREKNIQKKPATSELIDWIARLQKKELLTEHLDQWQMAPPAYKDAVTDTLGIIIKSKADFDAVSNELNRQGEDIQ